MRERVAARDTAGGRHGGLRTRAGFSPVVSLGALSAILLLLFIGQDDTPTTRLHIASCAENKALEPLVRALAGEKGVEVEVAYLGSVDIAREPKKWADGVYHAIWPASSLWIAFSDRQRVVPQDRSILRLSVVLGVKRSLAETLGWVDRDDVTIAVHQDVASPGAVRLAMTLATRSNSGASAYHGILHAPDGAPDAVTLKMSARKMSARKMSTRETVRAPVRELLAVIDRSSGSSGWLSDPFVSHPERFHAMINDEALVIEAERAFEAQGCEPLCAVYPADSLAAADSPLGFVARSDPEEAAKKTAFLALRAHMLSPPVQHRVIALGRWARPLGLDIIRAVGQGWNGIWGVDPTRAIAFIPTLREAVVCEALALYQTAPLTVWALDVSGSMKRAPMAALKQAMALLLDPAAAERDLLQPSPEDQTVVIAFYDRVVGAWSASGDNPEVLEGLLSHARAVRADRRTDFYLALTSALDYLRDADSEGGLASALPAIVAMTDGANDTLSRRGLMRSAQGAALAACVPIHAIACGDADETQLEALTTFSAERLFQVDDHLAGALRQAKGCQ